jgi:hypothetical protein
VVLRWAAHMSCMDWVARVALVAEMTLVARVTLMPPRMVLVVLIPRMAYGIAMLDLVPSTPTISIAGEYVSMPGKGRCLARQQPTRRRRRSKDLGAGLRLQGRSRKTAAPSVDTNTQA